MSETKKVVQSKEEHSSLESFINLYKDCPLPAADKLENLGLFIKRQSMSRMVFMYEIYKRIINIHGVVCEFGVRWGQNMALYQTFRGMLEPFNYTRKIVGFDTFSGFPSVSPKDKKDLIQKGDLSVTKKYEQYLDKVLRGHEIFSPLSHIQKYELVKGDATLTFKEYLSEHPETIIALAYFDFDLYEPTKVCLELCRDRFTKGSVIAFDELNHPDWPGETLALKDVLGLGAVRIERFPFMPTASFFVVE